MTPPSSPPPPPPDVFTVAFKEYRRRTSPAPSLANVLDLQDASQRQRHGVEPVALAGVARAPPVRSQAGTSPPWLLGPEAWQCYRLAAVPGLVVVANPFTAAGQRYWVSRCVRALPCRGHKTNLDPHHPDMYGEGRPDTLWGQHRALPAANTATTAATTTTTTSSRHRRKRSRLERADTATTPTHAPSGTTTSPPSLSRLRWTTLGFHYDWTAKEYRDSDVTPMPDDVQRLAEHIVTSLGLCSSYAAEAAILNFYTEKSTLGGHRDEAERDLAAPLVSCSFGMSAVFLIGGESKATPPTALLVRSGDVVVMDRQARLAYHAVPRMLPGTCPQILCSPDPGPPAAPERSVDPMASGQPTTAASHWCWGDGEEGDALRAFIRERRLNLNIRQVNPAATKGAEGHHRTPTCLPPETMK